MGEKHSKDGVFTASDVRRIRQGIREGIPTQLFAEEFEVSLQCIRDLATGATHADMNMDAPPVDKLPHKTLKAWKKRNRTLELIAEGVSQADISRQLEVSESYVSLVAKGER